MRVIKLLIWSCVLLFCLGFRTYDDEKTFQIEATPSSKSKIFVSYDHASRELENDLPPGDPLAGTVVTVATAMASVFNDFNGVQAAFVTLVDASDSDYAAESLNREISVRNAGTDGLSGGQANLENDGGTIIGCTIKMSDRTYESAKEYIATVTHELGHCLGLDHSHDTVHALMSYFYDKDLVRLQMDDKMGLIFLYPTDPSKAKEDATFGLSCSRR